MLEELRGEVSRMLEESSGGSVPNARGKLSQITGSCGNFAAFTGDQVRRKPQERLSAVRIRESNPEQ